MPAMPSDLPVAPSCLRNQHAILGVLLEVFADTKTVLEIGSGTGQHAAYFSEKMPNLTWQPTDLPDCIPGIERWREHIKVNNFKPAKVLDVASLPWPEIGVFEAVFTANTLHFMPWAQVVALFAHLREVTSSNAVAVIYGPFNLHGEFTSDGNAALDAWLKERNPAFGIRDQSVVCKVAADSGWRMKQDIAMPANNHILVFELT